ncbi:MAG: phosphoribosylaminoimidazolecarboxamide formyltransferase, partial [Synergistaceae bacterium]|nr:phosphoribosylaminoimidazolecarboxamide formyltransferase [Synergistaceae bacterium]
MNEYTLKYGTNPNQSPARIFMRDDSPLPLEILNGRPGYINFLDALNSWQLVRELRKTLKLPAAASFKHVSPAGAALGLALNDDERKIFFVDEELDINASPLACAYARARGTDRLSSFGDWIALSDECDEITASFIKHEVSDGIIAPSYTPKALEILKSKRKGNYAVVKIDSDYEPESTETRDIFGITFEQGRNTAPVIEPSKYDEPVTVSKNIPDSARRDLTLALITLKYTQSNSVCVTKDGQTLGVGAGQQSRLHCVKLACDK